LQNDPLCLKELFTCREGKIFVFCFVYRFLASFLLLFVNFQVVFFWGVYCYTKKFCEANQVFAVDKNKFLFL